MSEQTGVTNTTEETNEQAVDKTFSQEEVDRIVQERLARERAKFSDYEDLKAKADKFEQFEESQKTEAQKQQEALEAAQSELAELRVAKIRAEVAAEKGVPASLLTGETQEELVASADALIEFRGEKRQSGPVAPVERTPQSKSMSTADHFAEWSDATFN